MGDIILSLATIIFLLTLISDYIITTRLKFTVEKRITIMYWQAVILIMSALAIGFVIPSMLFSSTLN